MFISRMEAELYYRNIEHVRKWMILMSFFTDEWKTMLQID